MPFKRPGVTVECTVAWEKDVNLRVDVRCARKPYAAVVKTGHRTESFVYTPTDWHLLREAAAPALIAAEEQGRPRVPSTAAANPAA